LLNLSTSSFYTVAELWQYNGFQDGARLHHGILKIHILMTGPIGLRGSICDTKPNFVAIGQTAAET